MTHALIEQLKRPAAKLGEAKDELLDAIHGSAALTDADEAKAADAFDRSRGYHLTRAERADRAWRLAEGAPIVLHKRPGRDPIIRAD